MCTRVRVCACVSGGVDEPPAPRGSAHGFVRPRPLPARSGQRRAGLPGPPAPLPRQSSARAHAAPVLGRDRRRGVPAPAAPAPRKPRTLPGAAVRWPGSANLRAAAPATARTSCDAARAGKNLHLLRLWSKRDCAGVLLGRRIAQLAPSPHAKFLSSEGYLPAFVLSQLQCSPEKKGKLLEGGRRGLVTITTALPPLSRCTAPTEGTAAPHRAKADVSREREEGGSARRALAFEAGGWCGSRVTAGGLA